MEILGGLFLIIFFVICISIVENGKKTKLPKYNGTTPVCSRCGKSHYHTMVSKEIVVPEKIKRQTSLNLNPLKPFTIVNHKEKVVRKEISRDVVKYVCDECGNIWG